MPAACRAVGMASSSAVTGVLLPIQQREHLRLFRCPSNEASTSAPTFIRQFDHVDRLSGRPWRSTAGSAAATTSPIGWW